MDDTPDQYAQVTAELLDIGKYYQKRFRPDTRAGRRMHAAQQLMHALAAVDGADVLSQIPAWRIAAKLARTNFPGVAAFGTLLQLEVLANQPELVTMVVQRLHQELETQVSG